MPVSYHKGEIMDFKVREKLKTRRQLEINISNQDF